MHTHKNLAMYPGAILKGSCEQQKGYLMILSHFFSWASPTTVESHSPIH